MNKWRRSGPREGMGHTNDHLHSVSEKRREKRKKGSSRRRSHNKEVILHNDKVLGPSIPVKMSRCSYVEIRFPPIKNI
jgi:hypothetical protein